MLQRLLCLMLCLPALAGAAESASTPSVTASPMAGSVSQMFLGLAVVIAVLLVCLWLLKRLGAPRGSARGLKVLGAAPVGPRERVVLVEVADQVLVLGVAPGRVNMLHSVAPEALAASATAPTATPAEADNFASRLKGLLEARKS